MDPSIARAPLVLLLSLLFGSGCSGPSEPDGAEPERRPVEARIESYGLVVDNYTDAPIYLRAYRTGALAIFAICVDPETCPSVPARSTGTVSFSRVTAWTADAESVDIDYWHLLPSDGGFTADTVRTVVARR